MIKIKKIRRIGYSVWEKVLKNFNKLRGIKHNLSESSAEKYYLKLYKKFAKKYIDNLYEGGESLRILDVGCGTGRFAIELAELGHHVTGIDYMEDAIDKANKEAQNRGVSLDLKCGNAKNVLKNLRKNKYNVVLCIEMLYGNTNYKELMQSMRKLLSLEGTMICSHKPKFYFITTLLKQNKYKHALRVAKSREGVIPLNNKPIYYNWQTKSELKKLYKKVNMRLLGMQPIGMFSGFGVDGMSGIANPEMMGEREKEVLFDLETEALEDYVATGRYILTASSRK